MGGWDDLRRRLDPRDRRVYAFVHPCLPEEPLVILHTALAKEAATSVQGLMERQGQAGAQSMRDVPSTANENLDDPKVAVFCSISSTQQGLAGVDLGHFLIQRVAEKLLADFPSVELLVTLSPIPKFRDWLCSRLAFEAAQPFASRVSADPTSWLLTESDWEALRLAFTRLNTKPEEWRNGQQKADLEQTFSLSSSSDVANPDQCNLRSQQAAALLSLWLKDDLWLKCGSEDKPLFKRLLMRLAARYLVTEKRRNYALDPVANFHLRNGAQLWRINWR